jgi:membrane protease YdiL (CAAX protease family)
MSSSIEPRSSHTVVAQGIAACTLIAVLLDGRLWRSSSIGLSPDTLILFGLLGVLIVRDGDAGDLGLRLQPDRGWWHWCQLALWLAAGLGVVMLLMMAIFYVAGSSVPVPRIEPESRWPMFAYTCIYAPVMEELLFRSILTAAVRPLLGDWGTIIASGLLFAAVHILGGNPSPENQIGGFLLGWAFLRSRTILVPLAWHAAGNMLAFSAQVANWYLMPAQWP